MLAYDYAYVYLYEVCIMIYERTEEASRDASHRPQLVSTTRATLFIKCLEAVKNYLNRYLVVPSLELKGHSIIEKGQIMRSLIVLIRLSFCTDLGLEISAWRQACEVENYIDALIEHVESVNKTDNPVHYEQQRLSCSLIKAWYERMILFETSGTPSAVKGMSPLQLVDILKQEQTFCMDFNCMDFSDMNMLFFPETNTGNNC